MVKLLEELPAGFKLIPGTTVYYVNNTGMVVKHNKKGFRVIKLIPHETGWTKFYIYEKNKNRRIGFLHKVMAEIFIPNPNNYKYVIMKDGDRSNMCVENIKWGTYHDVIESSRVYEYTKPSHKAELKLTNKQIINLIKDICNTTSERYAWKKLAKKYNISVQLLSKIRTKQCYKEYWEIYGNNNYTYKSIYSTKFNKQNALMLIRDITKYDKFTKDVIDYLCSKYNISQFRLWNIRKQKVYKDIWKRDEFKNYKYTTIYNNKKEKK